MATRYNYGNDNGANLFGYQRESTYPYGPWKDGTGPGSNKKSILGANTDFSSNEKFAKENAKNFGGPSSSSDTANYVMAAGMFVQMFSTIVSAFAQRDAIEAQAEYKKQQLEFDAQVSDLQAETAIQDAERTAQKIETAGNQAVSDTRASAGAQGIEVNAGSAKDVQVSQKALSMYDAFTARNNGARQAFGYNVQSINDRGAASFAQSQASNLGNSTLLTGGLNALGQGAEGFYYASGGTIKDAKIGQR